ncbi:alpha/beta hydrolase-fold protein [Corynebacterium mayonis]|uniref:alpha/beta hydrolase-fold protein n=1 Tax=Corynebacterium mayonis TaxID=3062461 RepID=UPI0031406514
MPLAHLSVFSQVPLLAVPALLLAILGRGIFGSSLYQGVGVVGSSLSLNTSAAISMSSQVLPSMGREVKNDILLPGGTDSTEPRPTFYLMMGADGAGGGFTWHNSSDYESFFATKHVNVVTPKGSISSMQADWYREDPKTGLNKWLTYMTKELPPLIDATFHGTSRDAIAGISMSGGPAISIAGFDP